MAVLGVRSLFGYTGQLSGLSEQYMRLVACLSLSLESCLR
jgi:hypothetical protein